MKKQQRRNYKTKKKERIFYENKSIKLRKTNDIDRFNNTIDYHYKTNKMIIFTKLKEKTEKNNLNNKGTKSKK